MALFAIAIVPWIHRLARENLQQIWYADDAAAGGHLSCIKQWGDMLLYIGPDYDYFPKFCLIIEVHMLDTTALG